MDRPIFLNSSGGIIAPYALRTQVPVLNIAPYVETVTFPVVSVDSSAIFGDHPENLATVTISSGAALTFFVDSVAGGDDPSGNGSYDDPWRSLKTASDFLHCAQCVLNTAAKYIQVKVRGTVDYGSAWDPMPGRGCKLILAGWGGRCDLGSANYSVDYALGLKGRAPGSTCSGCAISGGADVGRAWYAVDCELSGAVIAGAAYNCSGGRLIRTIQPNVVYGGNYSDYVDATYVYSTHIVRNGAISAALYVTSAAVSANVTATVSSSGGGVLNFTAVAVSAGYKACLVDCEASAVVGATGGSQCYARAAAMDICGPPIVSGGVWYADASAAAEASGGVDDARAAAWASGLWSGTTAYNAQTVMSATAAARCYDTANYRTRAYEIEETCNLGTSCNISRIHQYSSSVVTSTTVRSSGSCP